MIKEPGKEMVFVKEKRCVVGSLINQEREIDALEEEVRNMKDKDAGKDEVVAQKGRRLYYHLN